MNSPLTPEPWFAAFQQALAASPAFDPAAFAASYQQLFLPAMPIPNPVAGTAGALRLQRATAAFAELAARAAADAAARFQAALSSTDPLLPKITTLRALHALWVDCGEAAYAAAAHAPAWAAAQAELLNALVAWRAESAGTSA